MQKIRTFLWFDDQAEAAADFYTSVIPGSRVVSTQRAGEAGPVVTVAFELAGQEFIALNGGPVHRFTPAISLSVDCADQAEVDELWARMTADGGEPGRCGWLQDRFGLSWQIVPRALSELLGDFDPARAQRAMAAMMTMAKIDVQALRDAADGTPAPA
jgi:predicted 3-demethylubiquinone-9 3-methyltransferase (glyoxalase superfamily)